MENCQLQHEMTQKVDAPLSNIITNVNKNKIIQKKLIFIVTGIIPRLLNIANALNVISKDSNAIWRPCGGLVFIKPIRKDFWVIFPNATR